jgi:hypothetical protein
MPAGKALIENVARALDPNIGMSAAEIAFHLPDPKPSNRAIRYAVKALVEQGRAKRRFNRGDLTSGPVLAVVKPPVEQQAAE